MGRTSDARERLIGSGRKLMHERGYTAVGVAEVCSHAGVNKGSFYYYFPTKQELALEVIDSFWASTREMFDQLPENDLPPLGRLSRFFKSSFERHSRLFKQYGRVHGCPFGNLALEMATQDDAVTDRLREIFDAQVDGFERLIADAVTHGEIPALDARHTALALMALIEGGVMLAKMHNDPELLRDLEQDALRLMGAPAT